MQAFAELAEILDVDPAQLFEADELTRDATFHVLDYHGSLPLLCFRGCGMGGLPWLVLPPSPVVAKLRSLLLQIMQRAHPIT